MKDADDLMKQLRNFFFIYFMLTLLVVSFWIGMIYAVVKLVKWAWS
jgi:hypothetical protein